MEEKESEERKCREEKRVQKHGRRKKIRRNEREE
jgi:hypothetical protein